MEAIVIEVIIFRILLLLCFLILPFSGKLKRRRIDQTTISKVEMRSDYGVNENGELELMKKEKSGS